ncbi:hypothetical protein B0T09DRAFT_53570 [Sordaria sp. MPI-SDFR-AT-0083]|nr:hypothetical protein B0T09DRAFT_53570 [Sordaria sp. MPI-SDFR-AT-0083]
MGKPGRQGPRLARALRETPKGSSGHLCSAALAGLASTALASGFPSGFLVQLVDQWAPLPVQPQNENASQPQLSVESQVVSIVPSRERQKRNSFSLQSVASTSTSLFLVLLFFPSRPLPPSPTPIHTIQATNQRPLHCVVNYETTSTRQIHIPPLPHLPYTSPATDTRTGFCLARLRPRQRIHGASPPFLDKGSPPLPELLPLK